ncbi:MAG: zinc dependent phospholipase C family protein [Deltaproteobacteria bacterium]|nr:zinc dependent phospholipase C family protein [Deltaproteobacteria bacterium]
MRVIQLLMLAGLFLLIPSPAKALGPAAHLEFGLAILKDLALLAPGIAVLLRKFPNDFLYGSIAADITVGKNLSPYLLHCHNWQVGFMVMDLAEDETTKAFAWGYLAHLAADIVAHNYFIPYKIVEHFRQRAAHVYWEIRFDTWISVETRNVAQTLSTHAFKKHDRHLRKILTGPLFSFRVNKQIFNSIVLFSQIFRWQRTAKAYARSTTMLLTEEEVTEMRSLAIAQVLDLLSKGDQAACLSADPTGHRNILIARDIRLRLRTLDLQGRLLNPDEIGDRFRPLFREAMSSKLTLPSMLELINPDAPAPSVRPLARPIRRRRILRGKKKYKRPDASWLIRGLLGNITEAVKPKKKKKAKKPKETKPKKQKKTKRQKKAKPVKNPKQPKKDSPGRRLLARVKSRVKSGVLSRRKKTGKRKK